VLNHLLNSHLKLNTANALTAAAKLLKTYCPNFPKLQAEDTAARKLFLFSLFLFTVNHVEENQDQNYESRCHEHVLEQLKVFADAHQIVSVTPSTFDVGIFKQ